MHRTIIHEFPNIVFKERGYPKTLLFFAGWGFDYRVFQTMDLEFNYVFVKDPLLPDIKRILAHCLSNKGIARISLLGWSMGCYLAIEFFNAYPAMIEDIFLLSARRTFPDTELTIARAYLHNNARAYLYSFYKDCFYPQRGAFHRFRKTLFPAYRNEISTDYLLKGLDYLSRASLSIDQIENRMISFIHGREDKIAQVAEIEAFCTTLPNARLSIIEQCGHTPFFHGEFYERFTTT